MYLNCIFISSLKTQRILIIFIPDTPSLPDLLFPSPFSFSNQSCVLSLVVFKAISDSWCCLYILGCMAFHRGWSTHQGLYPWRKLALPPPEPSLASSFWAKSETVSPPTPPFWELKLMGLSLYFSSHKIYFRLHCWEFGGFTGFIQFTLGFWRVESVATVFISTGFTLLVRAFEVGLLTSWFLAEAIALQNGQHQWGKIPENPHCIDSESEEVHLQTG